MPGPWAGRDSSAGDGDNYREAWHTGKAGDVGTTYRKEDREKALSKFISLWGARIGDDLVMALTYSAVAETYFPSPWWLLPAMTASSGGGGWRQQTHASHVLRISGTLEEFIQSMYAQAVTNISLTLISVVTLSSGCVAEARRRVQEDRHQLWRQQPQQQQQQAQQQQQQYGVDKLSLLVN